MTGRIVVGMDGSDGGRAALRWALDEAALREAPLVAVHAWESPVAGGLGAAYVPIDLGDWEDGARAAMAELMAEAEAEVGGFDVPVATEVLMGHPGQVLIDAAGPDDLLVVGTRGRGGFAGLLLGSISTYCVHHARSPVVIIRP